MIMKFNVIFVSILLALFGVFELGLCRRQHHNNIVRMKFGADEETPNDVSEIESLARFAIQQHNNNEVLKAKEQVVAGKIYYLTVEVVDAGKKKIYEAKIWVKPWMNFKQLQEFKLAHAIFPFRSSDLGVKKEGHKLGWHQVPIHDPNVKDAAKFYMKSLNMKVNCLCRYELLDIVQAKIKVSILSVIEDYVKFNLLLKVSMENKEEWLSVEVSKKLGGSYYLSM
ncbi:hypothetical protein TSUD_329520 [Trifolium subterraneum]|uniref:Cysteine proteinase inhibitor n=1 Tax=Trifolium subterraneum TaxID=3900 RepID=A0A2Z6NM26_TRISU|nr:hypothetical protein TSUD_329520 [Trifolium subterraneum]